MPAPPSRDPVPAFAPTCYRHDFQSFSSPSLLNVASKFLRKRQGEKKTRSERARTEEGRKNGRDREREDGSDEKDRAPERAARTAVLHRNIFAYLPAAHLGVFQNFAVENGLQVFQQNRMTLVRPVMKIENSADFYPLLSFFPFTPCPPSSLSESVASSCWPRNPPPSSPQALSSHSA